MRSPSYAAIVEAHLDASPRAQAYMDCYEAESTAGKRKFAERETDEIIDEMVKHFGVEDQRIRDILVMRNEHRIAAIRERRIQTHLEQQYVRLRAVMENLGEPTLEMKLEGDMALTAKEKTALAYLRCFEDGTMDQRTAAAESIDDGVFHILLAELGPRDPMIQFIARCRGSRGSAAAREPDVTPRTVSGMPLRR